MNKKSYRSPCVNKIEFHTESITSSAPSVLEASKKFFETAALPQDKKYSQTDTFNWDAF